MSRKSKIITGIIVIVLLLFVLGSERNRAALFINSDGYIEQGKKFGVEIGSPLATGVQQLISNGLKLYSETDGGVCASRQFEPDYTLTVFSDRSWRKGGVCLISKEQKIIAISWSYNPFTP
jgi:hypothetical protein